LTSIVHAADPPAGTTEAFRLFADILEGVQKHYLDRDRLDATTHAPAAFREFLRQLDPEADLLTSNEFAALPAPGSAPPIILGTRAGQIIVLAPRDGTGAQRAGLITGDELTDFTGSIGGAYALLQTATVINVRQRIAPVPVDHPPRPPVRLRFPANLTAYYRFNEISDETVAEFDRTLPAIAKSRYLILDLRHNATGTFDAALRLARRFLPAKTPLATLAQAADGRKTTFAADATDKLPAHLRIAILVNGGTAGAAEVFAAALQDHRRAKLVGSPTYGQGRQSSPVPLRSGFVLWLPTTRYLTPTGRPIYPAGLTPDVPVQLPTPMERDVAALGYANTDRATDPVLANALEIVRQ
jgi:carboxyl-terminal processing protease